MLALLADEGLVVSLSPLRAIAMEPVPRHCRAMRAFANRPTVPDPESSDVARQCLITLSTPLRRSNIERRGLSWGYTAW